jgi:hypothetical protein
LRTFSTNILEWQDEERALLKTATILDSRNHRNEYVLYVLLHTGAERRYAKVFLYTRENELPSPPQRCIKRTIFSAQRDGVFTSPASDGNKVVVGAR